MVTIINSVDIAGDVKDLIRFSSVKPSNADIRKTIFDANNNDFLSITKSIDSDPVITGVTIVDDSFVASAVLGE